MSPFERGFIKGCGQAGVVGGSWGVVMALGWVDGWMQWVLAWACGGCAVMGWLLSRRIEENSDD